jgi:hypothetical protein
VIRRSRAIARDERCDALPDSFVDGISPEVPSMSPPLDARRSVRAASDRFFR